VYDAQHVSLTEGESVHLFGKTLELVTTFTGGQKYSDAGVLIRVGPDSEVMGEGETQIIDTLRVKLVSVSHTYGRDNEQLGSAQVELLVSRYDVPLLTGYDLSSLPAPFIEQGRYNHMTIAVAPSSEMHAAAVAAHFQAARHLPPIIRLADYVDDINYADHVIVVGTCAEIKAFSPGCIDVPAGNGYISLHTEKVDATQAKHTLNTYLALTGRDAAAVAKSVDALVSQRRLVGTEAFV